MKPVVRRSTTREEEGDFRVGSQFWLRGESRFGPRIRGEAPAVEQIIRNRALTIEGRNPADKPNPVSRPWFFEAGVNLVDLVPRRVNALVPVPRSPAYVRTGTQSEPYPPVRIVQHNISP
jgi:hypothetical protein